MAANKPPLILVVDDSEPGRYVAVRTLRNAGLNLAGRLPVLKDLLMRQAMT